MLCKLHYPGMKLCAVCVIDNNVTRNSRCLHCQGVTVPFYPGHKGEKSFPFSRFFTHPIGNLKYHMDFLTYIHQILNFSVQNYTYNTVLTMFYVTDTERSRKMLYGNLSSVITVLVTFPHFEHKPSISTIQSYLM